MKSMGVFVRLILMAVFLATGFAQEVSPPAEAPPVAPSQSVASPAMDLEPDASGTVPQEQIRELLRRVAERDLDNEKRLRDYTYIQREEEHKLDGQGNVKKVESRTSEVLVIYGEQVERLIAKDDKPLSDEEMKKE